MLRPEIDVDRRQRIGQRDAGTEAEREAIRIEVTRRDGHGAVRFGRERFARRDLRRERARLEEHAGARVHAKALREVVTLLGARADDERVRPRNDRRDDAARARAAFVAYDGRLEDAGEVAPLLVGELERERALRLRIDARDLERDLRRIVLRETGDVEERDLE